MITRQPRPLYGPTEAIARMQSLALSKGGQYVLGTGDRDGYTTRDGMTGADCVVVFVYGYGVKRNRPGFNVGPWATISDDINCNSLIEDARHNQDLVELIDRPEDGCLITYPSVYKNGERISIGHIEIGKSVRRVLEWDPANPDYSLIDVLACRGPNGRSPAIITGTGAAFNNHDKLWPKPAHRTVMLRVKR